MTWQQAQHLYPHQWLVIAAVQTRQTKGKRVVARLQVLATCANEADAHQQCEALRRHDKLGHYKACHTANAAPVIDEGALSGLPSLFRLPRIL